MVANVMSSAAWTPFTLDAKNYEVAAGSTLDIPVEAAASAEP